MEDIIKGTIITLVIGGTAYSLSTADIATNFAEDTGVTQQQAEEYVDSVVEEDLATFEEIGEDMILDGEDILEYAYNIDCINYEYEWQSSTLSCSEGKKQLTTFGTRRISLGEGYVELEEKNASETEIKKVVRLIDRMNSAFDFQIVTFFLTPYEINEEIKTNSYNKALFKTALESS